MRRLSAVLLLAAMPAAAACPSVPEVALLASAILDRRVPPPPRTDMTMADALCARDRLVAVLAQPWGDQVGWRIAPAGVPGAPPLSGALFFGTLRERAGETFPAAASPTLPARFGVVPMVAAGLLLRVRDEGVNDAGEDHLALLRHVEAVIPFLDLPDQVYPPGTAWTPALRLASNLGSRSGVLGAPIPTEPNPGFAQALGAVTATLHDGASEVARGTAGGAVGHPLTALAWLVRDLQEQRRRLRAGDHVAIGLTPGIAAAPGDWRVTLTGLTAQPASVSVRLR